MKTQTLTKTKWGIDPAHSQFEFRVKHLMITYVRGVFRDVDVSVYTDGNDFLTADIEVRINAASIDTGDSQRDTHLKSPDFFDVENHKQIIFIGKKLEKAGKENKYNLSGVLSIKGVTVPVKLDVEYQGMMKDPWGVEKAGFEVTGSISRKDWELTWNAALETGGVLVGDEVKINCEIQLVKQTDSMSTNV
jgi:polyisoprenoid-binding protein YceI